MPLSIRQAATVVCLRRSPSPKTGRLRREDYRGELEFQDGWGEFGDIFGTSRETSGNGTRGFAKEDGVLEFSSGWQVLVGQSEVVNWVRSEQGEAPALMRYGGEYKFAGGGVDDGETLVAAARRELAEEFEVNVPQTCALIPYNVTQTRPVQERSYSMFNFVCIAEENPWLAAYDVEAANRRLAERRQRFELERSSGRFWEMGKEEREAVAPEVRSIEWLEIFDAVRLMMTCKCLKLQPINDWQEREFARLGVEERDPMFVTMATLLELENSDSIHDEGLELDEAIEQAQQLAENMQQRYDSGARL